MKNIGIQWVLKANCKNFTSDFGIRFRRIIGRPLRLLALLAMKRKLVKDSFPKLEKGKPYIFASTHFFDEDIIAAVSCIDRNVYLLTGSTHQIEINPKMYFAWLYGMIYVDRWDNQSRHDSLAKMERIINSGTSILIYPEGGYNNTENLLCNPLFSGVYTLAKNTGAEIVPICSFPENNTLYFNGAEPISVTGKTKDKALQEIRDALATLMYDSIIKYTKPVCRSSLGKNCRDEFLEQRRNAYLSVKWERDAFYDELTAYKDKRNPSPEDVRHTLKNVKVTKQNAHIILPILEQIKEDEKYNFNNYMHEHWNDK